MDVFFVFVCLSVCLSVVLTGDESLTFLFVFFVF